MQKELEDFRAQINHLDEQLVRLLNERAKVALAIGEWKTRIGVKVYDPVRERAVIERVDRLNTGPLDKGAMEELFATIIAVCREIQNR
ncbi:MAG TPA: chorismate mutase [Candidatus Saccharimonadales bacterium]|nr:chorismate mutase [Candidatus Saccharimonadales bacterium]